MESARRFLQNKILWRLTREVPLKFILVFSLSFSTLFSFLACDSVMGSRKAGNQTKSQVVQDHKPEILQLNGATATQIILPNQLKVVLISSPTSKKAAASLAVQVGFVDDPIDAQGLAHFLEHMLFQGTKEFPLNGEYSEYIESNGGWANASTSFNTTNYFFQVRSEKFDGALHRFSRFFVTPNFNPIFTEEEKKAVHNEFSSRIEGSKSIRSFMSFLKTQDPLRLFGVGNLETLKNLKAEDTREFFNAHYFAEAMQVVLAGPQTLEELKALAEKYFADIKSEPTKTLKTYSELIQLDLAKLPAKINVVTLGGDKLLALYIPIEHPKKQNPKLSSLMNYLVGDESQESLLHFLQKQGLARASFGSIYVDAGESGLTVNVHLTEAGAQNTNQIINYVFGYLEHLKKQEIPQFLAHEINLVEKDTYKEKEFYDVDANMVSGINYYYMGRSQKEKHWSEPFIGPTYLDVTSAEYQDYLKSLVYSKVLARFTHPDNVPAVANIIPYSNLNMGGLEIQVLNGKNIVVDSIFNFAFEVEPIDPTKLSPEGVFTAIQPNPYISQGYKALALEEETQHQVIRKDWGKVVYNPMSVPGLNKTYLSLDLGSDKINFYDSKDISMLFLFRELLSLQVANRSYPIFSSGFFYSSDSNWGEMFGIDIAKGALMFYLSGWSDKFGKAWNDLISYTSLQIAQPQFDQLKEFYINKLSVEQNSSLGAVAGRGLYSKMTSGYLDYPDLYAALESVTLADFQNFIERFNSGLIIEAVISGNINESFIDLVAEPFKNHWKPQWAPGQNQDMLNVRMSKLDPDEVNGPLPLFETNIVGPDPFMSAYNGFFNFGNLNLKDRFAAGIIGGWMETDFFEVLRNQKQIAYGLNASRVRFMDNIGIEFQLSSSTHDVEAMEIEVDQFFANWVKETLPNKSKESFTNGVENIIAQTHLPASSRRRHQFYVNITNLGYESVEQYIRDMEQIRDLKLEDVVQFGQSHLNPNSKKGAFIKVSKKPLTN